MTPGQQSIADGQQWPAYNGADALSLSTQETLKRCATVPPSSIPPAHAQPHLPDEWPRQDPPPAVV